MIKMSEMCYADDMFILAENENTRDENGRKNLKTGET